MKSKIWIGILAAVLAANETMILAYQKAGTEPKQPQLAQVESITPGELKEKIDKNEPVAIVDLRGPAVYSQTDRTIKGAIHTKVRRVVYRLREIARDREIVTYCACPDDEAAIIGARALLATGFTHVRVLKGGWNAWVKAGGQIQQRPR